MVHDQCSCNFTFAHLEDPQLTCSDDDNEIIFTTTVVYSSDSGDITATDIINVLNSWAAISGAAISGADALLEIGGNMATIRQVCSPSCEIPTPLHGNNLGGVAAGTFIGGLVLGMILLAIPVIVFW